MSYSTLYAVDETNHIQELAEYQNGFIACFPVWNYLNDKYFSNTGFTMKPPCWKLEKSDVKDSEYLALLTSFDGYTFKKENLPDIIKLLKTEMPNIPNYSRLKMFEDALHSEFDTFFITATSVADYEHYIDYHYEEDEDGYEIETDELPTLRNTWDLWEKYTAN